MLLTDKNTRMFALSWKKHELLAGVCFSVQNGGVVCAHVPCPNVACSHPVTPPGECCPLCTGTCWYLGKEYQSGSSFTSPTDPCSSCSCLVSVQHALKEKINLHSIMVFNLFPDFLLTLFCSERSGELPKETLSSPVLQPRPLRYLLPRL